MPKLGGLNNVDFWIGGLAEKKMLFGGMLGSTFNFVFEAQLEALQNGDRFYYLSRLANLNLTAQLENNKFSEMIHRNTTATHLPGDAFARPDFFLEVDKTKQFNLGLGLDGNDDPTGETIDIDPFLGAASGGNAGAAVIRSNVTINSVTYSKLEFTALSMSFSAEPRTAIISSAGPATTRCGVMAATTASKAATATTSSSVATATTSSPTCLASTKSARARATTSSVAAAASS